MNLDDKRARQLARAEWVDAWRVFPRVFVVLYGFMVYFVVQWFTSIKTYVVTTCNAESIALLLKSGVVMEKAQQLACTVTSVVGGPTTEQTVLVTTICGLSAAIFSFYTSTGRDWSKSVVPWKFGKTKQEERTEQQKNSETSS